MNTKTNMIIWYYYMVILIHHPSYSQNIYQSTIAVSDQGKKYLPINAFAQLISESFFNSWKSCFAACNSNTLCRIFYYEAVQAKQCRLFEGDIGTLGSIVASTISTSKVGTIRITASLFTQYNQPCSSVCKESRYLICDSNSTCQCMPHTYWNPSVQMCLPQSPIRGASCQQNLNMCREDLNYTCLQFNQCGRKKT